MDWKSSIRIRELVEEVAEEIRGRRRSKEEEEESVTLSHLRRKRPLGQKLSKAQLEWVSVVKIKFS